MRFLLAMVLVCAFAGCAASGGLTGRALAGTTWAEVCPAPEIATAIVRLEPDGHLAWSYRRPDSLAVEDVHTWTVERGELQLRWNEGSATSRYRAGRDPARLAGTAPFCPDGLTLQKVGG